MPQSFLCDGITISLLNGGAPALHRGLGNGGVPLVELFQLRLDLRVAELLEQFGILGDQELSGRGRVEGDQALHLPIVRQA